MDFPIMKPEKYYDNLLKCEVHDKGKFSLKIARTNRFSSIFKNKFIDRHINRNNKCDKQVK